MTTKLKTWVATGLLLAAGTANAGDLSSTVTLTSDYDFRGITQTDKDPALQASLDYAFGNGFAIGAWASNVDFGPGTDSNVELDLYGGYSQSFDSGFNWNAGFVYYSYLPSGDDIEYVEFYVGGGYKNFGAKVWYSNDYGNSGDDGYYVEANYTQPLPYDISLGLHVGTSGGDFWKNADLEYEDYGISVSKTFGHFNTSLKYAASKEFDDRVIFTIATTFPWGE